MSLEYSIEPVTSLKTKPAALIKRVRTRGQPVVITQHGKPAAVLQGVEEYEEQRKALLLLKILARGEEDYRSGRIQGHSQAKAHFTKKLRELKKRDSQI
jgi:prevent-host-death family protein